MTQNQDNIDYNNFPGQSILNPDLENVRNSALKEENERQKNFHDEILQNLLPKTKNIHATYLFHGIGLKLLQKLCIYLSGTKKGILTKNWKDFAIELGIKQEITDVIEHNPNNREDPTYYVFLNYIQYEDSTIDKILTTLCEIGRWELINETHELFLKFAENVNKSCDDNIDRKLLKPYQIKKTPFVLSEIPDKVDMPDLNKTYKYNKIVMLTYTTDSIFIAQMVANELRKPQDGKKIGVIILEEHAKKVNTKFNTFIWSAFMQADYIIPIISIDYLNLISSITPDDENSGKNLDNKYARYVYNLISNTYLQNGCCNDKIRCIIPNELVDEVDKHKAMMNSELKVWFNLSYIENLSKRILNNTV